MDWRWEATQAKEDQVQTLKKKHQREWGRWSPCKREWQSWERENNYTVTLEAWTGSLLQRAVSRDRSQVCASDFTIKPYIISWWLNYNIRFLVPFIFVCCMIISMAPLPAPCKKTPDPQSSFTQSFTGKKCHVRNPWPISKSSPSASSVTLSVAVQGELLQPIFHCFLAFGKLALLPEEDILGEVSIETQTFPPAAHVVYLFIFKYTLFFFQRLLNALILWTPKK